MHVFGISATITALAALVSTQTLNKPPLQQNLDNLKQGLLNNLKATANTRSPYQAGQIPADCKTIAQREGFRPADIRAVNVNNGPIDDLINRFGRLPVHARQYVRHVVSLPAANGYAYNDGGNIVFFGVTLSDMNVHIHETAHSLDLLNAYPDKPLSSSAKWLNAYNSDPNVPDPYSQTNQVENVAQNTVVATFDRNVPGGFPGLNPNANKIRSQYTLVQTEASNANPTMLLVQGGTCTARLANSNPVPVGAAAATLASAGSEAVPAGLAEIAKVNFNTNAAVLPIINPDGLHNETAPNLSNPADFHCAHDRTWVDGPDFVRGQCYVSLRFMEHEEGLDPFRAVIPHEFVTRKARPQRKYGEPFLTPRKYVTRKH
ncbi:MAG: hypothetical protein Q9219_002516 [cf. Caloplaca sp. 3 TL-2023]